MTFEDKFILSCLVFIEQILSDKKEMEKAIAHLTQGDNSSRYHLNSRITDSCNWTAQDKLRLNAAIFEAVATVSKSLYEGSTTLDIAKEINTANRALLERYLPIITEKTNPRKRLDSVKENSARLRKELCESAMENNSTKETLLAAENPFAFFTPLTASMVVLAATTMAFYSA